MRVHQLTGEGNSTLNWIEEEYDTWSDTGTQQQSSSVNLRPSAKDSSLGVGANGPNRGVILPRPYPAGLVPCEDAALGRGLWPQLPFWGFLIPVMCKQQRCMHSLQNKGYTPRQHFHHTTVTTSLQEAQLYESHDTPAVMSLLTELVKWLSGTTGNGAEVGRTEQDCDADITSSSYISVG